MIDKVATKKGTRYHFMRDKYSKKDAEEDDILRLFAPSNLKQSFGPKGRHSMKRPDSRFSRSGTMRE
jgi:hypothetical protein